MKACKHEDLTLVNPYELIRKYKCNSCGTIMMCSCDKYIGEHFLPHQIHETTDLYTQFRYVITAGFVDNICPECRGLPLTSYPLAEGHGMTSKFHRYYWREIQLDIIKEFGEFCLSKGKTDWIMAQDEFHNEYINIEKCIKQKYKDLHTMSPKYIYNDESQETIIKKYHVESIQLKATYAPSQKKSLVIFNDRTMAVEDYVRKYYESLGYTSLFLESVPFHVIFSVFMGPIIADTSDHRIRLVGFSDKNALEMGFTSEAATIWCSHPEDFGTSGYWDRRKDMIQKYISSLPDTTDGLLEQFNSMLNITSSYNLRQYLWASCKDDADRACQVLTILPPKKVKTILHYLSKNYWKNYLGWPDLLIYKTGEYFVAEVKSSKDKLTEDQKNWIKGNYKYLDIPFKLIKITR